MLKHEELVKASSRVSWFNRAVASSCPPPSPADNLVTANSGACQRPLHATKSAFSFSDFNSLNFALQVKRGRISQFGPVSGKAGREAALQRTGEPAAHGLRPQQIKLVD